MMLTRPFGGYSDIAEDIRDYVSAYGGFRRFLSSPYLHLAVIGSALCSGVWMGPSWSDLPLGILPNLLGFALAAYALLFAFGDEQFRTFLAIPTSIDHSPEKRRSKMLVISATFLHFVLVQVTALALAIVAKCHILGHLVTIARALGHPLAFSSPVWFIARSVFSFVSFTIFLLSITTSLAAAFAIFRATTWYVMYKEAQSTRQDPESTPVP
ncbi:MAG: hypothetical protein JWM87_1354 [Candidatus Eremiobacteraeota bacterium]|nr:hypothetical protein [Candidatus Eremiobacteraeota bacterium]